MEGEPGYTRSAALLWGLQVSLLSPALALILATLYDASTAEIGWVLALYNAAGFVAALVVPRYADRRHDYLTPMLVSGGLTALLAGLLAVVPTLPLATACLVVVGGPATVGLSMLFAHLRHSGVPTSRTVHVRAVVSVAWVAGPPLATVVIGRFGVRPLLGVLAGVAALVVACSIAMVRERRGSPDALEVDEPPLVGGNELSGRAEVWLIAAAYLLLQATNATAMTVMTLYVGRTLGLDIEWAGAALAVAAVLEVPALLLIGRLADRVPPLALVGAGCVAGMAYYGGLAAVSGPVALIALQVLNAASFAAVDGVGLPLFQQLIPGAGASTGIYMNVRRIATVLAGPLIALGSVTTLGQRGIFAASALLVVVAGGLLALAARAGQAQAT